MEKSKNVKPDPEKINEVKNHENNQSDPSMEDILDSIRKIIQDNEIKDSKMIASGPKQNPQSSQPQEVNEDILELTELVKEDEEVLKKDDNSLDSEELNIEDDLVKHQSQIQTLTAFSSSPSEDNSSRKNSKTTQESLLSSRTSEDTVALFQELKQIMANQARVTIGPRDKTLEDLVKESLKPFLKEWLDHHLPALVEKVVQQEIKKIVNHIKS